MSLLSPEEITRGKRYVIPDLEKDFIIQKGVVRLLLSKYLGQNPEDIEISSTNTGKPFIPIAGLQFNVSHSNDLLLCGFSSSFPVGVDIQHIYEISPLARIIKKILSPTEIQRLAAVPSNIYLDHFFTIWAAKEAFLKASGDGFSRSPNQFSIYRFEDDEVFLEYEDNQIKSEASDWTIFELKIDPDYKAVLALEGEIIDVKIEQFSPLLSK